MRISISHRGHTFDVDISGLADDATVHQLLDAVYPGAVEDPADEVATLLEAPVSECIRDGSTVSSEGGQPSLSLAPNINLHVVSGPQAGRVWQLASGTYRIGPSASITLDTIESTITVLSNGTVWWERDPFPAGVLRVGPHRLRLAKPQHDTTAHPSGPRSYFNRPPRHLAPTRHQPEQVPSREKVNGTPRRLSAIMLVLPVLTGVAMALILGRMMFLAFALLGPITMVGSTIDDRRRRRRATRISADKFEADVVEFERVMQDRARRAATEAYAAHPSVSELLLLARQRRQRLWERRPGHLDFRQAVVGYGAAEWNPDLVGAVGIEPRLVELEQQVSSLPDAPIVSTFNPTYVLGIAGDRAKAQRLAADLICQLCVTHGPVDVRVAFITDDVSAWDWAKWLPHVVSHQLSELRLIATVDSEIATLMATLRNDSTDDSTPVIAVVVDHRGLDDDQHRMIRECLSGVGRPTCGVIIVDQPEDVPTACTEVIELATLGRFRRPHAGAVIQPFDPVGIQPHIARLVAMALAPLNDPEAAVPGAGLPDAVTLLDLLEMPEPTQADIERRWVAGGRSPAITSPVGATETGTYRIDLVQDGPHGLIAGTTGAGKSELLRTLVAGLAANVSAEYLTFVLVDYKGGAAFDVCADLPHVVGMVTDLDAHLGQRAMLSLEAELHRREQCLRSVGATDIDDYWSLGIQEPLPRLVVVVDEFATLSKELPDFMDALVDVAQRGRSLGVHMVLATQRPSGVIKDSIRANTNLRISLRVQTAADSRDVLDSNEAAALPRSKPGRAYARLGPGELVPFQTALATATTRPGSTQIRVAPFVFSMAQPDAATIASDSSHADGPTDLARLVAAINEAFDARQVSRPRRPWTDALTTDLTWHDLPSPPGSLSAIVGIVDQPRQQRHAPWSWTPHDDGNLLLIGSSGWGPTDGLMAVALGLAAGHDPDEVHLYAIDHGAGLLQQLESLPHVGAVLAADDIDRQKRLLRRLRADIDRRRSSTASVMTVLLLDGIAGFKAAFDEQELLPYRDLLQEIAAHGAQHGVFVAATADQNRVVPSALAGSLGKRLVFALADRLEYAMLGVKGFVPELSRRAAIDPLTQDRMQVALIEPTHIEAVATSASTTTRMPSPVLTLSTHVELTEIIDAGSITDDRWTLPIGMDDMTLTAASLSIFPGDHVMIAGPGRSGRTTALVVLASAIRKLAPEIRILAVCPRSSKLGTNPVVDTVARTIEELGSVAHADAPVVVLVDDAEDVDDDGRLTTIIEQRTSGVTIVAAGRTDALRNAPRHWTRPIRSGRRGVILKPFDSADGDVLGVRLPRSARPIEVSGRGYLIDGASATLIQVATA